MKVVKCLCPEKCPVQSHEPCANCGKSAWRNGSTYGSFLVEGVFCSIECHDHAKKPQQQDEKP